MPREFKMDDIVFSPRFGRGIVTVFNEQGVYCHPTYRMDGRFRNNTQTKGDNDMRCCACDKLLEGAELYRKGYKYDMCSHCIPFTDEDSGIDVDIEEEHDDLTKAV